MRPQLAILFITLCMNNLYSQSILLENQQLVLDTVVISQEHDVLPMLIEGEKYYAKLEKKYEQEVKLLTAATEQYISSKKEIKELEGLPTSEKVKERIQHLQGLNKEAKMEIQSRKIDPKKLETNSTKNLPPGLQAENKYPLDNDPFISSFGARVAQKLSPIIAKDIRKFVGENKIIMQVNPGYAPLIYQAEFDGKENKTNCLVRTKMTKGHLTIDFPEAKDPHNKDFSILNHNEYKYDDIKKIRRCMSLMAKEIQRELNIQKNGGAKIVDFKIPVIKIQQPSKLLSNSDNQEHMNGHRVDRKHLPEFQSKEDDNHEPKTQKLSEGRSS